MKRRQEAVSQEMLHLFLVMQNSFLFSKHFHTHFVSCRGGVHDVFNNLSRVFHFVTCGITAKNSAGLNHVSFLYNIF